MKKEIKRALKKLAAQTFDEIEKEKITCNRSFYKTVRLFEYSVRITVFNLTHFNFYSIDIYEFDVDMFYFVHIESEKLANICKPIVSGKVDVNDVFVDKMGRTGMKKVSYRTDHENLEKALYLVFKGVQRLHDSKNT